MIRWSDELMPMMLATRDLHHPQRYESLTTCSINSLPFDTSQVSCGQLSKPMDLIPYVHRSPMELILQMLSKQQLEILDSESIGILALLLAPILVHLNGECFHIRLVVMLISFLVLVNQNDHLSLILSLRFRSLSQTLGHWLLVDRMSQGCTSLQPSRVLPVVLQTMGGLVELKSELG